jgi:hypothetical protein
MIRISGKPSPFLFPHFRVVASHSLSAHIEHLTMLWITATHLYAGFEYVCEHDGNKIFRKRK